MRSHNHCSWSLPRFWVFYALLTAFTLAPTQAVSSEMCDRGAYELNSSINSVESKGGLWGYVEKVAELREKSFLGLQADSALKHLVVRFESMCENGKTPSPEMFIAIQDMLSRARMIFNTPSDRLPTDKVIALVTDIKQDAEKLLGSLPQG